MGGPGRRGHLRLISVPGTPHDSQNAPLTGSGHPAPGPTCVPLWTDQWDARSVDALKHRGVDVQVVGRVGVFDGVLRVLGRVLDSASVGVTGGLGDIGHWLGDL